MSEFISLKKQKQLFDRVISNVSRIQGTTAHWSFVPQPTKDALKRIVIENIYTSFPTFCTGKFTEILLAGDSPTLDDFQQLPSALNLSKEVLRKYFVVYIATYTRDGQTRFRVYVGSAARPNGGAEKRIYNYTDETNMAAYVQKSLDEDFELEHLGIAFMVKIPMEWEDEQEVALFRGWILALECMVQNWLWCNWQGPNSQDPNVLKLRYLCPWQVQDPLYDRLVFRNALGDSVIAYSDGLSYNQRYTNKANEIRALLEADEVMETDERVQWLHRYDAAQQRPIIARNSGREKVSSSDFNEEDPDVESFRAYQRNQQTRLTTRHNGREKSPVAILTKMMPK